MKNIFTFTKEKNNFEGFIEIEEFQKKDFSSLLKIIDHQKDIVLFLSELDHITYLKNIYIKESFQGLGYGKQELNNLTKSFSNIILIADTFKTQRKNFDLQKFYTLNGFKTISYYLNFPVMFHTSEKHDIIKKSY